MNKFLITLARIPKCQPRFGFADILKDKDKGDETVYFTKEDCIQLTQFIRKVNVKITQENERE